MNNELLKKYIGEKCNINTLDQFVSGKIISLNGNWMEVELEGKVRKIELVNVEFIQKIAIV